MLSLCGSKGLAEEVVLHMVIQGFKLTKAQPSLTLVSKVPLGANIQKQMGERDDRGSYGKILCVRH